ncbi:Lysine-specific demethylase JMJ32 [Linum grandiflorum]
MTEERKAIESLWEEVRELSLGTSVERLDSPPSPLQFLRRFVSANKPCIISNAVPHWTALSLWPDHSYLSQSLSDSLVSLHLTPHGRADSLVSNSDSPLCFASAHVERVPFPTALQFVLGSGSSSVEGKDPPVAYLQQQNDCFREEYSALSGDCDSDIPWATEALGCLPEAVNLWIGNHLSETSFHKDHYENLYAVVSGEKHFVLLPPTDVHRMYIRNYPAAQYSYDTHGGGFRLEMDEPARHVPWCSVNPYPTPETEEAERSKFPLYFNGSKPFHCTVKAGEILYLPSMWFHHVRQSPDERGCTIAVNYWYDMQFDIKYAYFNFLQSIHHGSVYTLRDSDPPESDLEAGGDDDENEVLSSDTGQKVICF